MGTRADFYVGRGPDAEWLGSIAWDGYPSGITPHGSTWPKGCGLFDAKTAATFRKRVEEFFRGRDDVTRPEQGWPWPWDDSQTTDYAYAFDGGRVLASSFGGKWFNPRRKQPEDDDAKVAVFPNMKDRKSVQYSGKRSGLIVVGVSNGRGNYIVDKPTERP